MTEALSIETTSEAVEARSPRRFFALKEGDSFLVADAVGDIIGGAEGFFRDDTRVLSHFRLTLAGRPPSLLSAAISQDSVLFTAHMTNRPLPPVGERVTPKSVVHLERNRLLWSGVMYERLSFSNYGEYDIALPVTLTFGADFRDMFEVRGERRPHRGRVLPAEMTNNGVVLGYVGLDGAARSMAIGFSPIPLEISAERADFIVNLPRRG